jgi:hypothetical protein
MDVAVEFVAPETDQAPTPKRGTRVDLLARLRALGVDAPPRAHVAKLKLMLDEAEKADYATRVAPTTDPFEVERVQFGPVETPKRRKTRKGQLPVLNEPPNACRWCGATDTETVLNSRIKEEHGLDVYFCTAVRECDERHAKKGE